MLFLRRLAAGFLPAVGLLMAPVLLALGVHGVTWKGRGFGLGIGTLLCGAVVLLVAGAPAGRRRRRLEAAGLLGLLLIAPALLLAPPGIGGDAGLRVEHVFTRPASFPRCSLANLAAAGWRGSWPRSRSAFGAPSFSPRSWRASR